MTFEEVFQQMKELLSGVDVGQRTEHLAFQFQIEGEGEGNFYVELKDGKLYVEPYEYYDRDVLFRGKASTFLDIARGKVDPVLAFTIGKLKVEGDMGKALLVKEFVKKKDKTGKGK